MKPIKLPAIISLLSLAVSFLGICLFFIYSSKRDGTPAPSKDKVTPGVPIEVLNGPPALGKEISFVLVEMNPPLLVNNTREGITVANPPENLPGWYSLIAPPKPFYKMSYDEFRPMCTEDFLLWDNQETEEKYNELMAKVIPPMDWKGIKSSILYTVEVSGEFGKYIWIVKHPSKHLTKKSDLTAEDAKWLTYKPLKFHGGNYLYESPKVLESIGLDKFDYKDFNQLRSLAKAKKIDASGSMFKIIE